MCVCVCVCMYVCVYIYICIFLLIVGNNGMSQLKIMWCIFYDLYCIVLYVIGCIGWVMY
jgi:hypothetical protein